MHKKLTQDKVHFSTERYYYSRLSLSRSQKATLWNISRYPYRDISDFQKIEEIINRTTIFHKWTCNLTPEIRDVVKILWKREEKCFFFPTIFCYLLLDFHVKTWTRFSLRDKRLFEISEVEITRVDCLFIFCFLGIVAWENAPYDMWSQRRPRSACLTPMFFQVDS